MVILLDKHKKPLGMTREKRLRILCEKQRACIYKHGPNNPTVAIVKDRDINQLESIPEYVLRIEPDEECSRLTIFDANTGKEYMHFDVENKGADKMEEAKRRKEAKGRKKKKHERQVSIRTKCAAVDIVNWVKKLRQWVNFASIEFADTNEGGERVKAFACKKYADAFMLPGAGPDTGTDSARQETGGAEA